MENSEKIIARQLLSIGAVFLRPGEPFTWASGIKSPIYCDNRLILSAPESRNIVEQAIADKVRELYPEAEALMGTSTAGIAHAAIAASILGLPMGYVRSSAKDHGRTNKIEGKLNPLKERRGFHPPYLLSLDNKKGLSYISAVITLWRIFSPIRMWSMLSHLPLYL